MPRYKALAAQIMTDIDSGTLSDGQKLLSVRDFSQQHQVSMTTALNCYNYLLDTGYVCARPRSGYFVQKPLMNINSIPLPEFEPRSSQSAAPEFAYSQHPLATAQLSDTLLPQAALTGSANRVIRNSALQSLSYGDVKGHENLRRVLAAWYSEQGFKFSHDEIIVGHGCLDSVRVALLVTTKPGDSVVVASPCFTGLLALLKSMDRRVLEIPSTAQGIDLARLEKIVIQKKASALLLTANFQNPLGHQFSNQHKAAIAALANRFSFPVIEDDVYQELHYSGVLPLPIKHWDQGGDILWCSSFSKTLCASYRIGWCLPGRYYVEMEQARRTESLGVNVPLQLVLADFVACGSYRKHIKKLAAVLGQQVREYAQYMVTLLGDHLALSKPEGGMVLWCHVAGLDFSEIAQQLSAQQIIIRPGKLFSSRDFYNEYFRINCGWPLDNARKRDLTQLAESIKTALLC